jgi:hypothetical protein
MRQAFVLAAVLVTAWCGPASGAEPAPAPAGPDAVTERVRQIILEDGGGAEWGADPPAGETAERGEPVAATVLSGAGHALVVIDSDGRPAGSHLRLLHVSAEGAGASATECVLRLGDDEDRSCPPVPFSLVDCATWSVPAAAARAAVGAARAALFVRVYEKKFVPDPRQELVGDYEDGVEGGIVGSVAGGTTANFATSVSVIEAGKVRVRVGEEWAGYPSPDDLGRYARAAAAADIVRDAFPRPDGAPASAPPPAAHTEFSRLFATLPLDADFWWWVRERMVLMAGALGGPGDRARLEGYLTPETKGPSELRTRAYSLEALARRTRRDPRCAGTERLDDAAAAAAWLRGPVETP